MHKSLADRDTSELGTVQHLTLYLLILSGVFISSFRPSGANFSASNQKSVFLEMFSVVENLCLALSELNFDDLKFSSSKGGTKHFSKDFLKFPKTLKF